MGFFARGGGQEDERSDALARIEAGGIPAGAQERLRMLGSGGSLFTSGLSVNEFALLGRMGPRPLAQVMGASVVRTGWQYLPALLAMQRMQSEAQELGAEGIVGVSLSERSHGWGSHVIEFFALGTAIVSTGEQTKIEPPVTVLDLNDPRSG